MVRMLLSKGASTDLNSVNAEGMSTLYQSAAGGHIDIVRFLLNSGANPSIQTMFGWAPLHWAAANGHLACVRALLTAGADLNPMSDTSKTPFDMATSSGQEEIAHILRQAGAKTAEEVLEATATKNQSDTFTSQKSLDNGEDETNSNVSSSEDDEFRFVSMLTAAVNSLEGWSFPSMHIKKKVAVFLDRDLDEVMRDLDIEEFVTDEDRNTWKASLEQAKMTEGISALLKDSVGLEGSVGERKDVEDGNVAM
ncbi:ankyrin [Lindgomyces ingoldianus]|uniref:Ankyrin n=1 Tax=Lindgomyces ingoldianus TaxID=673940 RepID=A0ACB6RBJ4_9PLEO|nr:ankyrin [Lindgomyces ingoldianus]KAF2476516.1 ankyrin [Lindgomyces ingoldianus]